jgi:hypothetical protein
MLRDKIAEIIDKYYYPIDCNHKAGSLGISDEIISLIIAEAVPEEKQGITHHGGRQDPYSLTDHEKIGHNLCRAKMMEALG